MGCCCSAPPHGPVPVVTIVSWTRPPGEHLRLLPWPIPGIRGRGGGVKDPWYGSISDNSIHYRVFSTPCYDQSRGQKLLAQVYHDKRCLSPSPGGINAVFHFRSLFGFHTAGWEHIAHSEDLSVDLAWLGVNTELGEEAATWPGWHLFSQVRGRQGAGMRGGSPRTPRQGCWSTGVRHGHN